MAVMSGTEYRDYFVPRTRLNVRSWWPDRDITRMLFPDYDRWLAEKDGLVVRGDNSRAANNFLMELLPWLTEVIVQDGIYWIQKYPNHPVSILLKQRLPADYRAKRLTARAQVHQQQDEFDMAMTAREFQRRYLTISSSIHEQSDGGVELIQTAVCQLLLQQRQRRSDSCTMTTTTTAHDSTLAMTTTALTATTTTATAPAAATIDDSRQRQPGSSNNAWHPAITGCRGITTAATTAADASPTATDASART